MEETNMLKGKTAIVTGGTRGIGFAIVKKYLENGANVALGGSRKETVDAALARLPEYADRIMGIWPDLCDPEAVARDFAAVKERFGSIDILANNAGISSRTSLYDYTLEEFSKILDINLKSVFVCSQAAARIMKEQGGGVIISTSSMVSKYGQPSGCGYPITKFAVNGLTQSLARELAGQYPCECGGSRRYPDGYGSRSAQGDVRESLRRHSPGPRRRTCGYRQRLAVSGK